MPHIVQPQLFGLFSLLCWDQCLYYGPTGRSRAWRAVVLGSTLVLWAALEGVVAFVLHVCVFCSTISFDLVLGRRVRDSSGFSYAESSGMVFVCVGNIASG